MDTEPVSGTVVQRGRAGGSGSVQVWLLASEPAMST
jgi:hypothetical protein